MYPLPIVLLGIDEELMPSLQTELWTGSAGVESEFQSAYMAIDCLRHYQNQPRLLIVQTGADLQAEAISRLAASLKRWPIMALVSGTDREEVLRINRAGAVQVLALPLDSADFQQALAVIGSQFDRDSIDRHVFAVTSASSGSGATTIAANLACELAEQLKRSTILAELTPQMGSLASMFDLEPRVTLAHLLREINRVDDYLVEKTLVPFMENLKILAGSDGLSLPKSAEPEDLLKIVECLRKLADLTVLDLPGTFDEREFEVLRACEKVVVVGTQNVRSIKSLRLFCESLPEERQVHSLWVVLNRYNPRMKGFTCDDIKEMLGVARVLTVADDPQAVQLSVRQGSSAPASRPGDADLARPRCLDRGSHGPGPPSVGDKRARSLRSDVARLDALRRPARDARPRDRIPSRGSSRNGRCSVVSRYQPSGDIRIRPAGRPSRRIESVSLPSIGAVSASPHDRRPRPGCSAGALGRLAIPSARTKSRPPHASPRRLRHAAGPAFRLPEPIGVNVLVLV